MSAAYEELVELLDERGIGYWTSEDQAVCLDLRGEVALYRITAGVEPETDLFQVVGRSPLLVPIFSWSGWSGWLLACVEVGKICKFRQHFAIPARKR